MHPASFARFLLIALLLGLSGTTWAWDGNWTQGRSGNGDVIYDPKSSHGESGTDERPQKFLTPPPRDYADVDPAELEEYFKRGNKDYTPHALARISQNIQYQNMIIPKGYYLVEAANPHHGSMRTTVQTFTGAERLEDVIPPLQPASPGVTGAHQATRQPDPHTAHLKPLAATTSNPAPSSLSPAAATGSTAAKSTAENTYRVFVIKRLGKVIAVVPIHRMESYRPPRGEKLPKHALAWVETEDRHPVLKFYYKKRVYATDFQ